MNTELITALKEDAEWAHANEWETPITLGDHLDAAADRLEAADKRVKELKAVLGWIPVKEIIEDAPGVDAVPVVHARWTHSEGNDRAYDYYSVCGCGMMRRTYGYNPDGREYVTEQSYSFCPRCGARMDGKETDNGQ